MRKVIILGACFATIVSMSACGQTKADPCTGSSRESLSECADQMAKDLGIDGEDCNSSQQALEECAKKVGKELGTLPDDESKNESDSSSAPVASDAYRPSQSKADSIGFGSYDGLLIDMGYPNGISPSDSKQVDKFEKELAGSVLANYGYEPVDTKPHSDGLYVGCADSNVRGGYNYTIQPEYNKGLFKMTFWYDPGYGGYDLASKSWEVDYLPSCGDGSVTGGIPVYEKDATLYNSDGTIARQGTMPSEPIQ